MVDSGLCSMLNFHPLDSLHPSLSSHTSLCLCPSPQFSVHFLSSSHLLQIQILLPPGSLRGLFHQMLVAPCLAIHKLVIHYLVRVSK